MLQAILASKAFSMMKKYWQPIAGAFGVLMALFLKARYTNGVRKQTIKDIETKSKLDLATEQKALDDASLAFVVNDVELPSDSELELLRKTTRPSAKQKAAAKRVLKKLRPKGRSLE